MDLDTAVKLLGAIGGSVTAILQGRKMLQRPRPRQRLSEDIDIYLKTPGELENKTLLRAYIESSIADLYTQSPGKEQRQIDWPLAIFALCAAVGLGYWSYHLSKDGFSFWSILPGAFAVIFTFATIGSLRPTTRASTIKPTSKAGPSSNDNVSH